MRVGTIPFGLVLALAIPCAACAQADAAVESAPTPMTLAEIATIQQLCATASFQYARALDAKDPDGVAMAFAEDGVWEVLGNRMEGRDEIRGYWTRRTADWDEFHGRLHQISNQVIEVVDRDHARGRSTVVIYFFDTRPGANKGLAPLLIATNHDEYARTDEGWKLKHRRIERIADVAH